ncbi:zinc-dependent metalloprotease [Frankia sp. CNm7]|uniref:Zinc-dependent metalloprotease n=1 Tax=Frankia nepalensis TaxID=1836974 RepID=A0A937RJ18_9ACTN|nr:zinc-dependent metalloprotease [Frankia nepalensis]MBL7500760.1 zinc-dependent metalloprotease [Frankia nepalensis]MBL7511752.1 zinc-dependent metalloprotease [Frankia nepalensis]MBL7524337.1 zinc-dependent metalloprotease [Frankia nepalensis]MBL7633168.1 zinc-dependent metalloprotease [Frankia nepalensis]
MSSQFPFGFSPGGGGGDGGQGPFGPFGGMAPFFAELEKLLSWQGGPVNWDLAKQVAARTVGSDDPKVTSTDEDAVAAALRVADVWLDPVTTLPAGGALAQAWSRTRWIDATLPVWRTLCDPVAAKVVEAMRTGLSGGIAQLGSGGLPPELAAALPPGLDLGKLMASGGPVLEMMNRIGGLLFGAQVGQAIGTLAREVVSSTEIGLPLGPSGTAALLPANVAAFGDGLDISADEVRIYLALREAAATRLFGHVPWLRAHLLGMVEEYARGITIDQEALGRVIRMVDPSALMNPESLAEALGEDVFADATTPEQEAALGRLEVGLALVEGWIDHVTDTAASAHLPAAPRLHEMVRRRRAEGGPAEQTFATLVGLSLRPRRLREAAALWAALRDARGTDGRDAIWDHPDLLPSADDLANPDAFVSGSGASTLDPIAEIEKLLDPPPDEPGPATPA